MVLICAVHKNITVDLQITKLQQHVHHYYIYIKTRCCIENKRVNMQIKQHHSVALFLYVLNMVEHEHTVSQGNLLELHHH